MNKKNRLYVFIMGQCKGTFQIIHLNEIYCFLFVYGVIYTENIYVVLIKQTTLLITLRRIVDY